ncbi:MAG TPA: hypothetical protein VGD64_05780 [Acidisarcina sp.]
MRDAHLKALLLHQETTLTVTGWAVLSGHWRVGIGDEFYAAWR